MFDQQNRISARDARRPTLTQDQPPGGNGRRDTSEPKTRIAIIGGGAAVLMAMLTLRELGGDRAQVDLYSPSKDFVEKSFAVMQPSGNGEVSRFHLEQLTAQCQVVLHREGVASVDCGRNTVIMRDRTEAVFDYLLVAIGTKSLWVLPGATTFWGVPEDIDPNVMIDRISRQEDKRFVFAVPRGASSPLPLYELALMSAASKSERFDGDLTILTPEHAPLQIFGETVSRQIRVLLERHQISLNTDTSPIGFDGDEVTTNCRAIPADEVIALPRLTGRRVDGLPYDGSGFLPVDRFGQIDGLESVFAAGDVTSFPVKFGGGATQQADTAAAAIAASAWGCPHPEPFEPVMRGVLMTGDGPQLLISGEPMAPLRQTPDSPLRPEKRLFGKRQAPALNFAGGQSAADGKAAIDPFRPGAILNPAAD